MSAADQRTPMPPAAPRSRLRRSLLLALTAAACALGGQTGCSQGPVSAGAGDQPGPATHGTPSAGDNGTVGLTLTLPGGEALDSVGWTIVGPDGASTVVQQGSVDLQQGLSVSFVVGGIPAGSGYTITLSGTTADGQSTCLGSAGFSIAARATTQVAVALQCVTGAPDAGAAAIIGHSFNCALVNAITASPSATTVGTSLTLTASAVAADPTSLTYAWSAATGAFSAPQSQTTSFTCSAPGTVVVTVTVSDGPLPDGSSCDPALETMTVPITCVAANDAGGSAGPDAGDEAGAVEAGATDAGDAGAAVVDLDVYRVGDGTSALSNAATAVFVDEYTPAGVLVRSIALPTTATAPQHRLVASGTATSEGLMTRSADGHFLILAGYDAALGTASIAGSLAASVPRVVGRIDAHQNIDTTTALTDVADQNNPRGATSTDGTNLWITGAAGGIHFATLGAATSTQLSTTVTNLRQVNIFASQLYVSDSSGSAVRLGTVGTGAPTTSGQTITNLAGFPKAGSPYAFFFADLSTTVAGVDTVYVADDTNGTPGGITKYSLVGGTWVASGSVGTPADAYRGLTGVVNGTTVTLYTTRKGGGGSTGGGELATIVDSSGYNQMLTGTPTLLAAAGTNRSFRGVAFAPQP